MATAFVQAGNGRWYARGSLTSQGAATYEELTGGPPCGRVLRMTVIRTSGSGTTIDPSVTRTSASATAAIIVQAIPNADREAPETALLVDEAGPNGTYVITASDNAAFSMYLWPVFNSGSDNACTFEVDVTDDWP